MRFFPTNFRPSTRAFFDRCLRLATASGSHLTLCLRRPEERTHNRLNQPALGDCSMAVQPCVSTMQAEDALPPWTLSLWRHTVFLLTAQSAQKPCLATTTHLGDQDLIYIERVRRASRIPAIHSALASGHSKKHAKVSLPPASELLHARPDLARPKYVILILHRTKPELFIGAILGLKVELRCVSFVVVPASESRCATLH